MWVVDGLEEVGRRLLGVAGVPVGASHGLGAHAVEARDRRRGAHALVERRQHDRLPAAAGEPGHADALAVDAGVLVQVVEPLAHREIEEPELVHADEVEVRRVPVRVALARELSESEPFEVQREDAVSRQRDAALLLVLDGLPRGPDVAVDVEDRGPPGGGAGWLVEERGREEPGHDLVAQLADPIAGALDDARLLEPWRGLHPLSRPAVEDDVGEQLSSQPLRGLGPLDRRARRGRFRHARHDVLAQLVQRDRGREDLLAQDGLERVGLRLGEREQGSGECEREQPWPAGHDAGDSRTAAGGRKGRVLAYARRLGRLGRALGVHF